MLRFFHGLFKLVFTAALIAVGVCLYLYPVSELYALTLEYYEQFLVLVPLGQPYYRQIIGVVLAVAIFLTFVPRLPRRHKTKEISFKGSHGDVTIELGPVEATLERVAGKLPEVKTISIQLKPQNDASGVVVMATANLMKDADGDARQITARVNSYIQAHTRKILGLEDVAVKLKVKRFLMNMKSLKREPLLLEAPTGPESPVSTTRAPVQAAAEAVATATATAVDSPSYTYKAAEDDELPSVEAAGIEDDEDSDQGQESEGKEESESRGW